MSAVRTEHLVAAFVAIFVTWAVFFTINAVRERRARQRIWDSIGGEHWKPKVRVGVPRS